METSFDSSSANYESEKYAIIFTIFLIFVTIRLFRPRSNLPPSPPALPFIGHLHYFATKQPHIAIQDLAKQYGPIMYLQLGALKTIVISNEVWAKEVLSTRGVTYADRPETYMFYKILAENGSDLAMGRYGDHWRLLRKAAHKILTPKAIGTELDFRMKFEALCLVGSFQSAVDEDQSVNVRPLCERYGINILCSKALGRRFEKTSSPEFIKFTHAVERTFEIGVLGAVVDFLPILKYVTRSTLKEMECLKSEIDGFLLSEISRIQKEIAQEKKLGKVLPEDACYAKELLWRMEEEKLSITDIKLLVSDMLLGALDTTSTTLTFLIAILTNHPQVQDCAFEEIDTYLKRSRLPALEDLDHLPYTRSIIKEMFRVKPITPLVPRFTSADDVLNGYHIPIGTQVMVNVEGVHEAVYGHLDDFKEFKPERFMHEKSNEFNSNIYTFGGGRRLCVGMQLAYRQLFTAISALLYSFKLQTVDGKKLVIKEVFGLTTSLEAYQIRAVARFPEVKHFLKEAGVDEYKS